MNKAYSNKALPAGTVLREWRIDDVLGVGGFGIVYKAKGIYFNELVAIKEYFPSSISERDSEATVVPIDSEAEEVHALGLKKFVEEAKLLWNLSTPTRHPNIVSVRSLFEIHGTAYIVMDFEDGVSMSHMLRQGRRFNERSLWNILRPIAEGLATAHRVGVLHRDIKPPNILINEDNRPVLIDFGSARFDTADATSTKVTFHTPPYAAIEQYVKIYPQGPWTDIYALGVVMYECITGEKPPEVLERLHAGLGTPLAGGKWPGYSKRFLTAIDAAMAVKPEDRPQLISDWLAMFGRGQSSDLPEVDEATRFFAKQVATESISPVPPIPNKGSSAPVVTGVPADPKEAKFKRAGETTTTGKKRQSEKELAKGSAPPTNGKQAPVAAVAAEPAPPPVEPAAKKPAAEGAKKGPSVGLLAAAGAAAIVVVGAGASVLFGGNSGRNPEDATIVAAPSADTPVLADQATTNASAADANLTGIEDPAATDAAPPPMEDDAARAAAAEARLKALEKRMAKTAQAKAKATTETAAAPKPTGKAATATAAKATAAPSGDGVSAAKLSQFYSVVDDARGKAKKVMRSGNSQNAQLARGYDSNLKALRSSIRGVQSDQEADRLIKQATQTRAYIQFLLSQQ